MSHVSLRMALWDGMSYLLTLQEGELRASLAIRTSERARTAPCCQKAGVSQETGESELNAGFGTTETLVWVGFPLAELCDFRQVIYLLCAFIPCALL